MKIKKNFLLILLLTIFILAFSLMIFSGNSDSQTTDEAIHLFSGYTYLTQNNFRLDPEHPPFLKELGALPLLFFKNLNVSLGDLWDKAGNFYYDSWQETRTMGENFFYTLANNPAKLLFWGRLPFILLTLVLGYFGFLWAKKLYGQKAGVLAAFLILFFPNFLAHGRLVNTDLGLTLFIFLVVYFWGKFLKKPTFFNGILAGVFLGLVLASKFTGIIIVPILILLVLIKIFCFDLKEKNKSWWKYLVGLVGIKLIAFIIIWATYGFSIQAPPATIGSLSNNINLWTGYTVPTFFDHLFSKIRFLLFPAEFYKGLFLVLRHAVSGHGSFLLGQTSSSGWWYYFPVAIFYKTPIPIFLLLALSIAFWKKLRAKNLFDEILLILPPIIFLALSMFSKADLGVRHILPIFPFLIVFASKSINLIDFSKIKFAIPFLILIGWYLLSAILSFPNYLAYFNEFAGGSKNNYKILTDSNLDWGQDIYRLKSYLNEHNIEKIYIVYPWDGDIALRYYGINFEPLSPENQNIKGPVVVSATYFQTDAYSWLRNYYSEQITPGLFIINIP